VARMIPPQIAPDCASPGERSLFARFSDDPETSDWIVLHSLSVARHPHRLEGELDFIVLVPGEGVLCLEVKAGNVSRRDGMWAYGTGPLIQSSSVGPFRQAADAMHAIRNYIFKADAGLARLLFFSGVIFTHIDFDEQSPEWHAWQWAGRSDIARQPISAVCLRMLRRAHDHARNTASARWYDLRTSRPSRDQTSKLAELLRQDFEYFISPQVRVAEVELQIKRFTEEQFRALDVLQDNERIIYKGPAGTGKTLLAIEAAARAVRAKKRTLLVCYNRLLGDWLLEQTAGLTRTPLEPLTVGTFHAVLLRLSGMTLGDHQNIEFWTERLPERVLERALSGDLDTPRFDVVVLDEAQDLIVAQYLDVLEMLLEGGLAGGRWVFFGDFERQAIYAEGLARGSEDLLGQLRNRAPHQTAFPLRTNCRNAENIAIAVELACRMEPCYGKILSTEAGSELVVQFYKDSDKQRKKLDRAINDARHRFSSSQIAILSMKEDRASCASKLSQLDPDARLHPLRSRSQQVGSIPYTTIHAYKGLEAPAVILTDIDEFGGERMESLLYIGMSRARQHLCILMHESCRKGYEHAVREGFQNPRTRRRLHV
jgi:hypothetical protein